jgi:glycosyltransferase involved in cell wall biosynthesis
LIFVTSSLAHGGAERQSITLVNRLAQRGHECHAVYVKSDAAQIDRIRLRDGGSLRCLNASRYLDLRALSGFASHLSRITPSAVVAVNPYSLMYASLALRLARLRAPLAITFHTTQLPGPKEHVKMLLERPFFWRADRAIFVCHNQERHWLRRGVLARSNEVIYNGVDTAHFQRWDPRESAASRRALGYSDADYVIGMSAVLRPEKNHLQLVEAVAALRARGIPARALMIGDGPMRNAVEARARELGVAANVRITGFQQDVRPGIAASDVMVLCSTSVETFSLAALEAMAMGKPFIHSDLGGASEMIFPGRNGFLFPAGDTAALEDRLSELADREVAATTGRNARETVEGLFSEQTMVDRYERTLYGLCGLHPGKRDAVVYSIHDEAARIAARAKRTRRVG